MTDAATVLGQMYRVTEAGSRDATHREGQFLYRMTPGALSKGKGILAIMTGTTRSPLNHGGHPHSLTLGIRVNLRMTERTFLTFGMCFMGKSNRAGFTNLERDILDRMTTGTLIQGKGLAAVMTGTA